jgi:hypothetical protein
VALSLATCRCRCRCEPDRPGARRASHGMLVSWNLPMVRLSEPSAAHPEAWTPTGSGCPRRSRRSPTLGRDCRVPRNQDGGDAAQRLDTDGA